MVLRTSALTLLALLLVVPAWSSTGGPIIDFEVLPDGSLPIDGMVIANQYNVDPYWVTFSLVNGGNGPVLAEKGGTVTAFGPDDRPHQSAIAGQFFLNDGLVGVAQDVLISYTYPVREASGEILDVDVSDHWRVTAYDSGDNPVASVDIQAGDPGTGDARATPWQLTSAVDIHSIIIKFVSGSGSIGWAFDNFRPSSLPAEQMVGCVELAQESAPGLGDFDSHVLGSLQMILSPLSGWGYYGYGSNDSYNGVAPLRQSSTSSLAILSSENGTQSILIVYDDVSDGSGGSAETAFQVVETTRRAEIKLFDDPGQTDFVTGLPSDSTFTATHGWESCCTDGLGLVGLEGEWTTYLEFTTPPTGITSWSAFSADSTLIDLNLEAGRRVRLRSYGGELQTIRVRSTPAGTTSRVVASSLAQELAILNAGPNISLVWEPVLSWLDYTPSLPAFRCDCEGGPPECDSFLVADPTSMPYVSADTPIVGAHEVTNDNCSPAFYMFTFELPAAFEQAHITGEANVDDQGVLFLNGHRISGEMHVPQCEPAPSNGAADSCYLEQDAGWDGVDSEGKTILTWPTSDKFSCYDNAYFKPGTNSLVFAVSGNASYFEPTGVEFEAYVRYCLVEQATLSVNDQVRPAVPLELRLLQNPVRNNAVMEFVGLSGTPYDVSVFDVRGRLVRSISSGVTPSDAILITWDGRGTYGRRMKSGIYFVRFQSGQMAVSRKLSLIN